MTDSTDAVYVNEALQPIAEEPSPPTDVLTYLLWAHGVYADGCPSSGQITGCVGYDVNVCSGR